MLDKNYLPLTESIIVSQFRYGKLHDTCLATHTTHPPIVVLSTHSSLHITTQYTPFSRSLSCSHDKLVRSSSEVRLHWLWATASSIDMGDCASHIGVPAIGLPGADIFGVTACSCGVPALSGDIYNARRTLRVLLRSIVFEVVTYRDDITHRKV